MASFCTLPPPLLLNILKYIPDLYSLQSLRCASAVVNRILHEQGIAAEVTEAILSSGSTLVTNQFLVRTAVLILWGPHSGNIRFDSLESLRAILFGVKLPCLVDLGLDSELPGSRPLTRWESLPTTALLRTIALSRQVQKLVHHCFHTLLDRVFASHPRRPIDPMFDYRKYSHQLKKARKSRLILPPPEPIPPSEPIVPTPVATDPPSWSEQQLLEDGAWSFALYSLLRNPTDDDASGSWPLSIESLSFSEFWEVRSHTNGLVAVEHAGCTNATRISAVVREGRAWDSKLNCCAGFNLLAEDEAWLPPYGEQDRLRLPIYRPSSAYSDWHATVVQWSPIYGANTTCWDRLGFKIWSGKRTAALGFMVHADDEMRRNRWPGSNWPFSIAKLNDLFVWRSVMTDEQVKEMEKKRQANWVARVP